MIHDGVSRLPSLKNILKIIAHSYCLKNSFNSKSILIRHSTAKMRKFSIKLRVSRGKVPLLSNGFASPMHKLAAQYFSGVKSLQLLSNLQTGVTHFSH